MMTDIKTSYDTSISKNYTLMYSYAENAKTPVIYARYRHNHDIAKKVINEYINNFYSLYFFMRGNFSFIFGGKMVKPVYGDIILTQIAKPYTTTASFAAEQDYYQVDFSQDIIEMENYAKLFGDVFKRKNFRNLINVNQSTCNEILKRFHGIEKLIEEKDKNVDILSFSNIVQILGLIASEMNSGTVFSSEKVIPEVLNNALEYMHKNYTYTISPNDVTKYCHITNTYLCRLFKKFMLCTPNEYLLTLRISHAKYLIINGYNVTDTCGMCGFSNYTYFISKFKEIVGTTPLKYKKV